MVSSVMEGNIGAYAIIIFYVAMYINKDLSSRILPGEPNVRQRGLESCREMLKNLKAAPRADARGS